MKSKTINAILCKKFDEFVGSITDPEIKKLVENNSIITGGCIASMLLQEQVNDFDLYFTDKKTTKAVAEYYVKIFNEANGEDGYVLDGADIENLEKHNKVHAEGGGVAINMSEDRIKIIFKSAGVAKEDGAVDESDELDPEPEVEATGKPKYRPVFLSPNAITLSDKIQIVIRFYGDADHLHLHYDYVHCTNYWTSKDRKLTLKQPALEALMARELIYIGSKYPICSMIRTRKFIKRGFTINAGQYLKMAFQVSQLDLTDLNVLEDQLIGVDVAYFYQLIDGFKNHKANHPDFKLEYSYLASIIDKIF